MRVNYIQSYLVSGSGQVHLAPHVQLIITPSHVFLRTPEPMYPSLYMHHPSPNYCHLSLRPQRKCAKSAAVTLAPIPSRHPADMISYEQKSGHLTPDYNPPTSSHCGSRSNPVFTVAATLPTGLLSAHAPLVPPHHTVGHWQVSA